uniref:BED-type domain-containing protein n=1 Tax=Graphocephala atropunctata TaxID=36148 RepID=A0A1B6MLC9_9HEMI
MVKKKGPAWDFFKEKDKGVVCKYCSKEYKQSNVNKMTKHIKKCFKCPQDMKKYLESQTSKIQGKESMRKSGEGLKELSVDVSSVPPEAGPSSFGSQRPGSAMSSKSDMSISGTSSASHETEILFLQPTSRSSTVGEGRGLLSFVDTMDPQLNVSYKFFFTILAIGLN